MTTYGFCQRKFLPIKGKVGKNRNGKNMQILKYLCNIWLCTHILGIYQVTVNSQTQHGPIELPTIIEMF